MTPGGRFGVPIEPGAARTLVAFAAGSGITPVMAILKTVLRREAGRFFLFYGNRSVADIIFREQLEDLKDRYLARLSVFHVLSREQQDIAMLNGHLDAEKVRVLMRSVVPVAGVDQAFVCGPQPMIEGLAAGLPISACRASAYMSSGSLPVSADGRVRSSSHRRRRPKQSPR